MITPKQILKIKNLTAATPLGPLGATAPVNLTLHSGEVGIFLNDRECRKLFRTIIGQGKLLTGNIDFLDNNSRNITANDKDAGFLLKNVGFGFRDLGLISNRTILENVDLPARYHNYYKKGSSDSHLAKAALTELGVPRKYWDKRPPHVAISIRKRALLARAIVLRPPLLLLDEPTALVESPMLPELLSWIDSLKDKGFAILIACTDYPFAGAAADWVVDPDSNKITTSEEYMDPAWTKSGALLKDLSNRLVMR